MGGEIIMTYQAIDQEGRVERARTAFTKGDYLPRSYQFQNRLIPTHFQTITCTFIQTPVYSLQNNPQKQANRLYLIMNAERIASSGSNPNVKPKPKRQVLSVFSLVMINIIAVDSIRTLPIAAKYGFSLVFFYIVGALLFFIPTALITAELATAWPEKGGMYSWVKRAFGPQWGLLVVYLQWIYNIVWYPTILTLIASTVAYLVDPALVENQNFMLSTVLITFWSCTILNCFGMRLSSLISAVGSLLGTLAPMLFMIILAAGWLIHGYTSETALTWGNLIPNIRNASQLVFLSGVLYSLLGLEMAAVHILEVKNPQKDYPKALLISSVIIIFSLVLASLAIAIVVPQAELNILTGIIQAFSLFFDAFGMRALLPLVVAAIVVGGVCCVAAWIIGPTKGLFAAADDKLIPRFLQKTNRFGVPVPILILQGIICTIISCLYLLFPSVTGAYWILSAMTAQLAFVMYAILFAAAIRLRYVHAEDHRPFCVPGGNRGMWLVAGSGFIISLFVIAIGFIPPPESIDIGNVWVFEGFLIGGIIILLLPWFINRLIIKPE